MYIVCCIISEQTGASTFPLLQVIQSATGSPGFDTSNMDTMDIASTVDLYGPGMSFYLSNSPGQSTDASFVVASGATTPESSVTSTDSTTSAVSTIYTPSTTSLSVCCAARLVWYTSHGEKNLIRSASLPTRVTRRRSQPSKRAMRIWRTRCASSLPVRPG